MKNVLVALFLLTALNSPAQSIIGGFRKKKADKVYAQVMEKQRISDSIDNSNRQLAIAHAKLYADSIHKINEAESLEKTRIQKEKDIESQRVYDSVLNAQNRPEWEKLKMDSIEFIEKFGSVFEYKAEKYFMENSRNKFRALFIGAKAAYINYLFLYLMQKGMDVSTDENTSNLTFKATGFNNEQQYDIKMNGTLFFDKNQRTTSLKITGTPQAIIDLFIDYWENYDLNFNELKSKKTIYTMNASDKVNFSWTGTNPVITITKGAISFEYEKNKNLVH